jgi:lipopolysaccharide export system permease protein
MLTINELNYTLDSLQKSFNKDIISYSDNIVERNNFIFKQEFETPIETTPLVINKKSDLKNNDILSLFSLTEKAKIFDLAKNNLTSNNFSIVNSNQDLVYKKKNINRHWIVVHEKFVLAYACLLMFFIGAPLGSIIKKGGLGLPIVFAVIIFITYHFMNLFGRKLAEEDAISPFLGTWMSSIVLTPLAIYLTVKATRDLGGSMSLNFDGITDFFKKIFTKQHKQNNDVTTHTT